MQKLHSKEVDGALLIAAAGRIDFKSAPEFEQQLLALVDSALAGGRAVLLNLQDVPYMSSAGLRSLMMAYKKCQAEKGKILVFGLNDMMVEIFQISRFDKIFRILPNEAEAIQAARK